MRIVLIALLALAMACSGGSDNPPRGGDGDSGDGDSGDGDTGDGDTGDGDENGFDNGGDTGDSGTLELITPDGGGGCQAGVFCDDTPDSCGSLELEAEVEMIEQPGNVLVIFDCSGSMDQQWNGQVKWRAAGQALIDALTPIADRLTVGAVFFPSPGASGSCGVNQIMSPDQIDFQPGADFLAEFGTNDNNPKYRPVSGGRTPLSAGITRGQAAIAGGGLTGAISVIVITDGEPNCSWDIDATLNVVGGWGVQDIDTYVVGLPGAGGAAALLDELASVGNTVTHITPTDSAMLASEIQTILLQTVSVGFKDCEFDLNPPAEVPDKLHLVVNKDGMDQAVERDLGTGGTWSVSDDGSSVILTGNLCDAAKAGAYASIRFEYGCVDLPPLDPPVGPS